MKSGHRQSFDMYRGWRGSQATVVPRGAQKGISAGPSGYKQGQLSLAEQRVWLQVEQQTEWKEEKDGGGPVTAATHLHTGGGGGGTLCDGCVDRGCHRARGSRYLLS
jgi:hypothetical protein